MLVGTVWGRRGVDVVAAARRNSKPVATTAKIRKPTATIRAISRIRDAFVRFGGIA